MNTPKDPKKEYFDSIKSLKTLKTRPFLIVDQKTYSYCGFLHFSKNKKPISPYNKFLPRENEVVDFRPVPINPYRKNGVRYHSHRIDLHCQVATDEFHDIRYTRSGKSTKIVVSAEGVKITVEKEKQAYPKLRAYETRKKLQRVKDQDLQRDDRQGFYELCLMYQEKEGELIEELETGFVRGEWFHPFFNIMDYFGGGQRSPNLSPQGQQQPQQQQQRPQQQQRRQKVRRTPPLGENKITFIRPDSFPIGKWISCQTQAVDIHLSRHCRVMWPTSNTVFFYHFRNKDIGWEYWEKVRDMEMVKDNKSIIVTTTRAKSCLDEKLGTFFMDISLEEYSCITKNKIRGWKPLLKGVKYFQKEKKVVLGQEIANETPEDTGATPEFDEPEDVFENLDEPSEEEVDFDPNIFGYTVLHYAFYEFGEKKVDSCYELDASQVTKKDKFGFIATQYARSIPAQEKAKALLLLHFKDDEKKSKLFLENHPFICGHIFPFQESLKRLDQLRGKDEVAEVIRHLESMMNYLKSTANNRLESEFIDVLDYWIELPRFVKHEKMAEFKKFSENLTEKRRSELGVVHEEPREGTESPTMEDNQRSNNMREYFSGMFNLSDRMSFTGPAKKPNVEKPKTDGKFELIVLDAEKPMDPKPVIVVWDEAKLGKHLKIDKSVLLHTNDVGWSSSIGKMGYSGSASVYFETKIEETGAYPPVIGWCDGKKIDEGQIAGSQSGWTWNGHGQFFQNIPGKPVGTSYKFSKGDVIGCQLNLKGSGEISYFKNGEMIKDMTVKGVKKYCEVFYPVISLHHNDVVSGSNEDM